MYRRLMNKFSFQISFVSCDDDCEHDEHLRMHSPFLYMFFPWYLVPVEFAVGTGIYHQ